ncbi:MAG: MFS family permease [Alphaproteobacteria bacterium]|jgi:MFS family permease
MTPSPDAGRNDTLVIGLVGLAHLLSHFFQVALGPLFPLLRLEFGVSYTALGLIISLFYGVSGVCQAFAGIIVDKYGADRLLIFGLSTMATAVFLMGLAPTYWWLLPLAVVSALGNCFFHPADLSILSEKISPSRMGRAFAAHGLGGTCGYFLSPIIIYYFVASSFGWRAGLMVGGLLGWLAVLWIIRNRSVLRMPRSAPVTSDAAKPGIQFYKKLLTNGGLMSAFAYFALIAAAGVGMQAFSITAFVEIYDTPLYLATAGLTAFLGATAMGIIAGGEMADRFPHHALIATTGLIIGASLMGMVAAFSMHMYVVIGLLACAGFFIGMTGPSRDILVRAATPTGATGKVFGFVYSGLDLGSSSAPLLFGALMDGGHFRYVFVAIAIMYALGILSVLRLKKSALESKVVNA